MKSKKIISLTMALLFVLSLGAIVAQAGNTLETDYSFSMGGLGSNETALRSQLNNTPSLARHLSGN